MALTSVPMRLSPSSLTGAREESMRIKQKQDTVRCAPMKRQKGTFMSMILEAVKGAKHDVLQRKTLWDRIHRSTVLSAILVREVSGLFAAAPYGLQALSVYRALDRDVSFSRDKVAGKKAGGDDEALSIILWLVSVVIRTVLALRAMLFRRSAPLSDPLEAKHKLKGVKLVQDIRYGPEERNVLDVYIPPASSLQTAQSSAAAVQTGAPVLLFVHGGVWASGEKWQYAPMAVKCAQEGVVVVAIQYTLFPEALSCKQAQEVSHALTWVLDNVEQFGGDPTRIFLSGHSSGAHICALAIWERACAQLRLDAIRGLEDAGVKPAWISSTSDSEGALAGSSERVALLDRTQSSQKSTSMSSLSQVDTRQPHCFLGLSGVYDIAKHLAHEMKRGVDVISCMTPANGGGQGFAQRSPSLLLAALSALSPPLEGGDTALSRSRESGAAAMAAWAAGGSSEGQLRGERSKAAKMLLGLEDGLKASSADLEAVAAAFGCVVEDPDKEACKTSALKRVLSGRLASLVFAGDVDSGSTPSAVDAAEVLAKSQTHARQLFPLSVLTCSPGDIVVPPDTSVDYGAELRGLGMPCKVLVYDSVTHSDFACWSLDWSREKMPPHVADMLDLLTGKVSPAT